MSRTTGFLLETLDGKSPFPPKKKKQKELIAIGNGREILLLEMGQAHLMYKIMTEEAEWYVLD